MDVQHDHGHADRHGHQDHGEQQVFPEERDGQGRRRDNLGQQQEEHGQWHEYVTAQGHLRTQKATTIFRINARSNRIYNDATMV